MKHHGKDTYTPPPPPLATIEIHILENSQINLLCMCMIYVHCVRGGTWAYARMLGALLYHFPIYSLETGSLTETGAGLAASKSW